MKNLFKILLLLVFSGAIGLWITRPQILGAGAFSQVSPDAEKGAVIFAAMGCASCHKAEGSDEALVLSGGLPFKTDFGTFFAPNISSDSVHGIGGWSDMDIANAIIKGTSPKGQHYYPVFPFPSYARTKLEDVADLIAFLRTLPASPTPSKPHDLGFPFNIRATMGGWKLLFLKTGFVIEGELTPLQERGRYLVEALGHCGECHTPRNVMGGPDFNQWLGGAPNPSGKGRIPDLRPASLKWSESDIAEYLASGFTPEFDTAGGEMVEVIENTSQLPSSDREAIAAYLLIVPDA